jgi:hypothetical protein
LTEWWLGVRRDAEAEAEALGGLLSNQVAAKIGPVSLPTLTRYWPSRGLPRQELIVGGRTFVIFTDPAKVHQVARLRATGPAWNTWLNPEWRSDHAPQPLLKETRAVRDQLRPLRRGPKPASLFGSDRELECARAFIRHQSQIRANYDADRRAGRSPLEPHDWWAVERAADELVAGGWNVSPESARQLVWRAVQKLANPLQIQLT